MAEDPYKILGVPKAASQEVIRKAYRKLAKKLHMAVSSPSVRMERGLIADNTIAAGRAANCRVEIVIDPIESEFQS